MKPVALVFSCEHAVNTVPDLYAGLRATHQDLLSTHRGFDISALRLANYLHSGIIRAKLIPCELVQATISRLLIDCNRSLSNAQCFSELTRDLPSQEKESLIAQYYLPFRQQVIDRIAQYIDQGFVVWHLSIHSFTPILHGVTRNADIGFLYDPRHAKEQAVAKQWQQALKSQAAHLHTRRNYPYKGISDGFTSALRIRFAGMEYLGLELEMNQSVAQNKELFATVREDLLHSLLTILPE